MANLHRGQIAETIDGKRYVFRLGANEWAELEEELGKDFSALVNDFYTNAAAGDISMKVLRSYFRAALSEFDPDITDTEAGKMMSDVGMMRAAEIIGRVIAAGMPDDMKGDAEANPQKPAARGKGGRRSTKAGLPPASRSTNSGG